MSKNKQLLNERYARERLGNIAGKSQVRRTQMKFLEGRYVSDRIRVIEEKRQRSLIAEARVRMLFEAITVEQLQEYLRWFDEVRKFVNKFDIPALKKATDDAYNDVTSMFGGVGKNPNALVKVVRKVFGQDARGDDDRLNDVNHFLWGVTTVVSTLPMIIQAVDQQLDGRLKQAFKNAKDNFDDETLKKLGISPEQIATQQITGEGRIVEATLGSIGLGDLIGRLGEPNVAEKLKQMIVQSFTQSVADFGAGKVPYIGNPSTIADQIMELDLDEINDLGEQALDLKKKWDSARTQMQQVAKAVDVAADSDQELIGKKGGDVEDKGGEEESGVGKTGRSDKRRANVAAKTLDLGGGDEMSLAGADIKNTMLRVAKRLTQIGNDLAGGTEPDEKMKASLRMFRKAVKQLVS